MTDASIMVGYKQPDLYPPSSPSTRTPVWLWLVTLTLLGAVVFLQQIGQEGPPSREDRLAAAAGVKVEPPRGSTLVVVGKLVMLTESLSPGQVGPLMETVEEHAGVEAGPLTMPEEGAGEVSGVGGAGEGVGDDGDGGGEGEGDGGIRLEPDAALPPGLPVEPVATADASGSIPPPAENRFRVALLEGEVYGAEAAGARLRRLLPDLDPESPLRADVAAALTVYEEGPGALDADTAEALAERHGWFGRLLLTHGMAETEPARVHAVRGATWAFVVLTVIMLGVLLALLTGLVLLVVGGIMGLQGQLRPALARPRVGSPLWLETFAMFVGGFLLLQVVMAGVEAVAPAGATWPLWANLLGQWSLALLVFWPVVRGMSAERFRGEIGWHRGRGLFREIGAGVIAYMAALPIYFGVAFIVVLATVAIQYFMGVEDAPPMPENNRVVELLDRGGLGIAVLLASLVVLWAPIVEETMFRGALYRAVRSPLGAGGAAVVTALFFAVMHGYAPIQLILVGTLGVVFAFMREWRGSIIPSMTAHCLHNGIVLTVMLMVVQLSA